MRGTIVSRFLHYFDTRKRLIPRILLALVVAWLIVFSFPFSTKFRNSESRTETESNSYIHEDSLSSESTLNSPSRIAGKNTHKDFRIEKVNGTYVHFPSPRKREVIGHVAQHLKLLNGVEVGVQKGYFAADILRRWTSCNKYVLVDLWGTQENYHDESDVGAETQEDLMREAITRLRKWKGKIEICRNSSLACSRLYESSSLDFAYIDARHDFKAVLEDLEAWYPKVRLGGIIAGHDHVDSLEVKLRTPNDWTIQEDGSVDYSRQAARGAVNLFFAMKSQYMTYPDMQKTIFKSWIVIKSANSKTNPILHFTDLSCLDNKNGRSELLDIGKASKVTDWLNANPGFTSIVWTCELVKKFFPDLIPQFWASYPTTRSTFEDFVKFHALYKFGGIFVDFKLRPLVGVAKFAEVGLASGKPFAFCAHSRDQETYVSSSEKCPRVSTLMLGSSKGASVLKRMAFHHKHIITSGKYRHEVSSGVILLDVLQRAKMTIFLLNAPFPADECDVLPYREECMAYKRTRL